MMHAKHQRTRLENGRNCSTSVRSYFTYLHLDFKKIQQFVYRNVAVQNANNSLYMCEKIKRKNIMCRIYLSFSEIPRVSQRSRKPLNVSQ
jgi:hypothetical protein